MAEGWNVDTSLCVNETCTFRIVNGTLLTTIGVLGTCLSSWIVYNMVSGLMRLPGNLGNQNLYIMNVMYNDALLGVAGTIRGLGILSKAFLGVSWDGKAGNFCYIYTLLAKVFWNSPLLVLVPLTVDRFAAVMWPFRHRQYFTNRTALFMIFLQWVLVLSIPLFYIYKYSVGNLNITYQWEYHRCVYFTSDMSVSQVGSLILYFILPLLTILILYAVMSLSLLRAQKPLKKLLTASLVICALSVLWATPSIILRLGMVEFSYKTAQVLTVTLYYVPAVSDPLVYYCSNPRVRGKLGQRSSNTTTGGPSCTSPRPPGGDQSIIGFRGVRTSHHIYQCTYH